MYTLTQFILLLTMVLVVLTAGGALFHERTEAFFLRLTVNVAARIGDWAFGIHDNVWEAVHTSDWKPGRLGNLWLRFVNLVEKHSSRLAIAANARLIRTTGRAWNDLADEGTFVEAD